MWSSGILPIVFLLFVVGAGLLFPPSKNFRRAARPGDKRLRTDGREGGGSRPSSLSLPCGIVAGLAVVGVFSVEVAVAVDDDVDVIVFDAGRELGYAAAVVDLSRGVVGLFLEFIEGHEAN